MDDLSDEQLMLLVKSDHSAAFHTLFERHKRGVLGYLWRRCGDRGTAEDILQEVFLGAWRARGNYEPVARFTTWLYAMARNACANHLVRASRERARIRRVGEAWRPSRAGDGPHERLQAEETGRAVEAAVAGALPSTEALQRFGRVVGLAMKEGASAIHVGPVFDVAMQRSVPRLSLRVGGELSERERLSDEDYRELLSRTKQMADLDLAEQRLPQDGRMMLSIGGKSVDLLVNTAPTVLGERICLRLCEHKERPAGFSGLGLSEKVEATVRGWLGGGRGLVLLCGAACQGREALYALLAEARGHVASVEDPVESVLPGVDQVQADPRIGLTAARAIRAAMRQDLDVLGIGELRGPEETDLAVEAALAGRLVIAQVAAADAAGAVARVTSRVFDPAAFKRAFVGVLVSTRDGRASVPRFEAMEAHAVS